MSNFSGNVRKNLKPEAVMVPGVGRVIGGVYAGQDAPVVYEKAASPVLDTTPTPRGPMGAGKKKSG